MRVSFNLVAAALFGIVAAKPVIYNSTLPTGGSSSLSSSSSCVEFSSNTQPTGAQTETLTTYTTVTTCPVTKTYSSGSSVWYTTTMATSTVTVTTCQGGCHHRPTHTAISRPPTNSTISYQPTGGATQTSVSTITKFVPCSTAVSSSGTKTWYSTFLTVSYQYSTYLTTIYPTPTPTPTPITKVVSPAG